MRRTRFSGDQCWIMTTWGDAMAPATVRAAASILLHCHTLSGADNALQLLRPHQSRATIWGLFDGWANRPRTSAGLGAMHFVNLEYYEACNIGHELAIREKRG